MSLAFSLMLFVGVATITPGGATALAMSAGMHFGVRGSVPLISGLVAGLSTMAAVAAFGLGRLLLTFPRVETALTILATIYFLWLAYGIASTTPNFEKTLKPEGVPSKFSSGTLLIWLNPKAWTMTLGAAASFNELAETPTALAFIFGSVFAVFATASLMSWSYGGAFLAKALKTKRQWRMVNFALALTLVVSIIPIWGDKL